jgi:hypothetical protein
VEIQPDGPGDFQGYKPIPQDTWLNLEVTKIEDRRAPWLNRDTGEEVWQVAWTWNVIEEGEFQGRKVFANNVGGNDGWNRNPLNNNYAWAKALLGAEALPTGSFDTDMLIGRRVRALIGARTRKDKDTGVKTVENFISDVMPFRDPYSAPTQASFGGNGFGQPVTTGASQFNANSEEPF